MEGIDIAPGAPAPGAFQFPSFDYNLATVFHFVLLFLWLSCILWLETPSLFRLVLVCLAGRPLPHGIRRNSAFPLRKEVPPMIALVLLLIPAVLFTLLLVQAIIDGVRNRPYTVKAILAGVCLAFLVALPYF